MKFPQESYSAVVCAIQSDYIFLQRVTSDVGGVFAGVEKMIRETFLSHLFSIKTKPLPPIVGALSTIPVKKVGLGLLNTVTSAKDKYISYHQASAELIKDMMGERAFSNADCLLGLREESYDGKKNQDNIKDATLKGLVRGLIVTKRCLILRTKITGEWLNVQGTTVTGTVFFDEELCDFLCTRYNVTPPQPP